MSHKSGTAAEIASALCDIPKPSIYRQLKILYQNGFLAINSTKKIRGTVEITYALSEMKNGNIPQTIQQSLFLIAGDFAKYFSKPDCDPVRDMLNFSSSVLMLSDAEFADFLTKLTKLALEYTEQKPSPERRERRISFISSPVEKK